MNKQRAINWVIFIVVAAVLVALDLWLKYWANANLQSTPTRDVIPRLLGLTYTRNTGAAFGLLSGFEWGRWVLVAVKVVLMCGLLFYFNRLPEKRKYWWLRVPIILVFAGGIGNLYDRIRFGYVRDMLMFLFVDFPIFNLADVFVVCGVFVGGFLLFFVFYKELV